MLSCHEFCYLGNRILLPIFDDKFSNSSIKYEEKKGKGWNKVFT